jgi:hypothetical protein
MSSRDQMDEKLERLVGQALRAQPPRRAPASLEGRVLREITARARLPWWRRGISSWPLSVRIPVIAACAICVPLVWVGSVWLAAHLVSVVTQPGIAVPLAAVRDVGQTIVSLGTVTSQVLHDIPRDWLVGGLIATATLYAALFALVALGYSLLYPRTDYSKARLT